MRRDWGPLALVTQVGLTVVATLLLSLLFGLWLDGQLGTRPLFILVFSLLGVGASMLSVYRMVSQAIEASVRERGPLPRATRPGPRQPHLDNPDLDREPNGDEDESDQGAADDDWPERKEDR